MNIVKKPTPRVTTMPSRMVHEKFSKACQSGRVRDVEQIYNVAASLAPVDVDRPGADRKTPLFHAIVSHSAPLVRYLINKCQADVNRKSFVFFRGPDASTSSAFNFESCDEPPIVTAARAGNVEILRCLLENGACANDRPELANHHKPDGCGRIDTSSPGRPTLSKPGPVYGGSALHFACEAGNFEMVELLVEHGADVNASDHKSERPLHLAVRCKTSLCATQRQIVELLCQSGAEVDATNKKDCSPLYLASLYGCTSKVEVLLLNWSNPNAGPVSSLSSSTSSSSTSSPPSGGHGTALHVAANRDRLPLAALLIAHGARLNFTNAAGLTALQVNMSEHARSEIAPMLVYHGARMDGRDKYGRTLMAICIGNLRLDCESLAVLMVQAGYDLTPDRWLVPGYVAQPAGTGNDTGHPVSPAVAIPAGRVRKLCDWLHERQETPRSLAEVCRVVTRRHLAACSGGRTIVPAIYRLPLPTAIKNFLLLKDPTGSNIERPILNYLHSVES